MTSLSVSLWSQSDQPSYYQQQWWAFSGYFSHQPLWEQSSMRRTNMHGRFWGMRQAASGKWEDVDADDISAFLGFALLMGINRLPQLHLYWNTNPAFHYLPIGADHQGPLPCHLEVPALHHNPTPIIIINGYRRVIYIRRIIFFLIRSYTYPGQTMEGPAHNIGSCGCLPHQLPASSGAGY